MALIPQEYRYLLMQATKVLGHGKYSLKFLQQIIHTTSKLEHLEFGKNSSNDVIHIIENIDDDIQSLLNNKSSVEDFIKFLKLRALAEKAPHNLVLNKHPEHVLAETSVLFHYARQTFSALAVRWTKQKNYFLLSNIPNSDILNRLAVHLRQNNGFHFLSVNYWHAKLTVKKFLVNSNTPDLVNKLEILALLKRQTEQEIQRTQYQAMFGPLFLGFDTDWRHLEELIEWAQNLAEVMGTSDKAKELLSTQVDPVSYIFKTTAVNYQQWLKVSKAAKDFNISLDSFVLNL